MNINNKEIDISNSDKLIYPDDDITKMDIVDYYIKVAEYMLPLIENRPIMLQRFPDGIDKDGFFQKDKKNYFPKWIKYKTFEKKEGGKITHVICDSKESLTYLANLGTLTIHTWLSSAYKPKHPDRIILDLDPPCTFGTLKKALPELKEYLDRTGLKVYLMTTGSRGVHLIIPIIPELTYDKIRDPVKAMVKNIIENTSGAFTNEQLKEKRADKVYLDSHRNNYAQTGVAPFSLRPIKNAPVATPVSWRESNDRDFSPQKYHFKNIFRRLSQVDDPWATMHERNICLQNLEIISDFRMN